ncbi:transcriptional regulator, TetR family [Pseudonocardia ammonioxydans]|uniref:Transcriptional regulator, TetR family n=1 Tax=Pseudonocardia ammonioxydans TaxID=260086 RepID=A0A1I5CAG2_PSUAM|nr:helix-turn-helix domain-containing protein [Pseudonocardia ammonioxydans]SFN83969.1 transcriptional regulator, TetR family [Pseudonocardia ammonioxydans]
MSLTAPTGGRRRGRPPALSPDTIADAVLTVGFPTLTFAAVAARLGVGQATLYRHAANRDELVRLGIDLALRRTDWPDLTGPWKPLLERWAVASWRVWERHPGAVAEVGRGIVPPSIVVLADRVGAALVERGFTAPDAVLAVDLVFDLAADNRRGIEVYDAPGGGQRDLLEQQWRSAPPAAAAAGVRAEMVHALRASPIDWFLGKLRIVLAGIDRELAPPVSRPP